MNIETSAQRLTTPTWMKNLICSIWLMWPHLTHTAGRLSATNIQEYIAEQLQGSRAESYIPEIRTIQRILADFRPIARLAKDIDSETVAPLIGGGWPEDSDDTAFLVALVRSWGEGYHPDRWNPLFTSGSVDYDDPEPFDYDLDGTDNQRLVDDPGEGPSTFPLSSLEIKIALQLKGSLGWPRDFEEHGGQRNPWQMTHPRFRQGLPGELAIIKEMALRKRYAEESDSYDGDCSDILDILMNRPWRTEPASENLLTTEQRSHIKWNRNNSQAGYFKWDTIRWNSIYFSATNSHSPESLVRCIQRYIDTGDDTFRKRAEDLLSDLLPTELTTEQILTFDGGRLGYGKTGIATWHLGRLREAQRRLAVVVAHMESIGGPEELVGDRAQSNNGLNRPHGSQHIVESDGQTPWMALSLEQVRSLDPTDDYFINVFWCSGCSMVYVPVREVASAVLSPRAGIIMDKDLIETAFSRLTKPMSLRLWATWKRKYQQLNPDFESSLVNIKELIQRLGNTYTINIRDLVTSQECEIEVDDRHVLSEIIRLVIREFGLPSEHRLLMKKDVVLNPNQTVGAAGLSDGDWLILKPESKA